MIRLLCGYHLLLADIAQDQRCYKAARGYFTNAIILAREKEQYDLEAVALFRREAFFDRKGNYAAALQDFEAANQLENRTAPQTRGKVLVIAGRSKARLAQDFGGLSTALRYSDAAEKMIKPCTDDDILFSTVFDQERYFLDRAATLMASPIKKLRSPDKAQECLDMAARQRVIGSELTRNDRQVYSDLVQAKIYSDRGYYPVAVVMAEQILDILRKMHSHIFLKEIANLVKDMKENDPQSREIINLELALVQVERPYLFN